MNRRAALQTFLYIAGGTLILPACFRESGSASITLTNLSIDEEDELMLAELVDTIIPATDTPGGKELLLHLFVLKMVDDCHSPEDQVAFQSGLKAFAAWSRQVIGKPFRQAEADRRVTLLNRIGDASDETVGKFFGMAKGRAVQGYMNSQYVMTNLVKYELIPGRYNGYFPVEG